ncbi:hypothetical protein OAK93_00905, partial [bacterium]|nr:hypothetical protein [Akkermansiaceae bacterium]MDC0272911.1 hypothetical protein [bacterium]
MSILACLIGILTLMISVMIQVQQMKKAGRTEEEMALAMKNRTLIKKAEKLLKEGDLKQKELQKEKATVSVMEKLKDRKIALTMELEGLNKAKNKSRSDAELQKQVENMRNEIIAIKEERPPLAKRLKDLENELKRREEKPK